MVSVIGQTTTHASLLARLSDDSDRAAWVEFYARYADLIRGFARRQNVSPEDCEDILQDVLLGLSRAMGNFAYDPAKGKFRSYLKTTVLHAIFRKSHQKPPGLPLDHMDEQFATGASDAAVESHWEAEWRKYHLGLAMKTIGAEFNFRDRAAFERYGLAGEDARVTADALNMSVDQVYQAKSRIVRRLGELIEQQVQDEG